MLISHMSEDSEIYFYWWTCKEGVKKEPKSSRYGFEGFYQIAGLPQSKNGKNSHLKIFDVLLIALSITL